MTLPPLQIESAWEARLGGAGRCAAFLLLVLGAVPLQAFARFTRCVDQHRINVSLYRALLRILGFRLRVHGTPSQASPTLFVANHTSYLDIPVLGAVIPGSFVAKAEVAQWPFFGWLARLQNTAFIERRASRAATQRGSLLERLLAGNNLVLFPEGTSTSGLMVRPFKSSLFSLAEASLPDGRPVTVQPVTVSCTEWNDLPMGRRQRPYYAWFGDMTLLPHLWRMFVLGRFTLDVYFHPPVTMTQCGDRKKMAEYCETKVREGLQRCLSGRHGNN